MADKRPDPDALLSRVRATEREISRGKLKIFFGFSPGVGKTYDMLEAARARQVEGARVLVGVVETHGRKDTAALLEGLDLLPARIVEYRGASLKEFDLDEAIKRAEARGVKRREEWLAKQEQQQAEASSPAKGPEETKGWVLVVYITESSVNSNGASWIPFVPMTNSTTGEFLLLHDGKPMLAARHNSVGAYSNSSPRCWTALASAFDIKMAN